MAARRITYDEKLCKPANPCSGSNDQVDENFFAQEAYSIMSTYAPTSGLALGLS